MFNKFGYFKEYYINNKFIGMCNCEKDRDVLGFFGTKIEITEIDIILSNKKLIKKGTNVKTVLQQLCGVKIRKDEHLQ